MNDTLSKNMVRDFVASSVTKSQIALIGSILGFGFIGANSVQAASISLGTASNFAVLADSTVTNIGSSIITGDLGVSSGSAVTGFPPGIVTPPGTIHAADAVALQAQADNQAMYNYLAGLVLTQNLTGQNLGGQTLTPGVYFFSSSAQLTGTLTLNSLGDPNALFVFQIGSTLTTASNSSVVTNNGSDYPNVFFQVGSSATLGTGTQFKGNILANTNITLNTSANIECGRALAQNGAVTLDTNNVSTACASIQQVPEPFTIIGTLVGSTAALRMRKKLKASGF
ncbi:ice-binding family protein [Chamaesiphon sp. VAR_48_metabat_135_sub]|uniref:ice-binding family protein n=1 Tax=Chamaesiphon sp. VAR_48_metabat_135_sub TaxID=2964699 RepID=UPI00286C592C|nr:ice-binding family protein [Chamaesiphon sp. VAR_48_metabat_135_sub]